MFGNMMGDFEEKQKALSEKLAGIIVEAEAGNGAVKITANANGEITNITIDKEALDWEDHEQVEDLLLVAINRALQLAEEKKAAESQKLIQDMLPPGLGDLGGLFGE